MNTIIGELGKSNKFVDLSKEIEKKQSPISISGLTSVGIAEIVAGIKGYNKKPILLVTYNEIQAKKILENIKAFETENAVLFPKKEIVTYDYVAESKDLPYERIEILNKIKEVCFSEDWLQFRVDNGSNGQRDFLINYIEQLPPVTPTRKKGKWEREVFDLGADLPIRVGYQCSECGNYFDAEFNFCPHCGAEMESEE